MISVVSTVRVQAGKAAEFEQLILELTAKVRANEPGNLFYQLVRSRTESGAYRCVEFYRDQAAFEAHGQADYFRAAMGRLATCMAGEPQVEFFDPVE